MKFLEDTGLLPTADELAPLTDDENDAILESLFLTVIADGKIEPNETKAFAVSALTYPWNWGASPDAIRAKLEAIGERLRDVDRDAMTGHLRQLGHRIPTAILREKTFAGMFALMISDGKLDEKEKAAALAFAQIFDIPESRSIEIIQGVMAALMRAVKK